MHVVLYVYAVLHAYVCQGVCSHMHGLMYRPRDWWYPWRSTESTAEYIDASSSEWSFGIFAFLFNLYNQYVHLLYIVCRIIVRGLCTMVPWSSMWVCVMLDASSVCNLVGWCTIWYISLIPVRIM